MINHITTNHFDTIFTFSITVSPFYAYLKQKKIDIHIIFTFPWAYLYIAKLFLKLWDLLTDFAMCSISHKLSPAPRLELCLSLLAHPFSSFFLQYFLFNLFPFFCTICALYCLSQYIICCCFTRYKIQETNAL